ncbi:sensor histidine kinase [Amycolatopsis alba]|uniref:histidine kinase n=1 Tax=Amycolatopsis alba DSM 44262 TaxID=1125972 RepID=A0A229RYT7_AMYAL|nr:histidine kinase [Amycolatopsis alba]OXM51837.1 two-component sensor histidine kinase [Amycolatopsis alba DSM 44262]
MPPLVQPFQLLRTRPLLTDCLITAAAATLLGLGAAPRGGSFGDPVETGAVILAVSIALPLVMRRRQPIAVLLASVSIMTVYTALGYRATLGEPSAFIAAYTVWARYPPAKAVAPTVAWVVLFEWGLVLGEVPSFVADTTRLIAQCAGTIIVGRLGYLRADRAVRAEREIRLEAEQAVVEERIRIAHELHDVVSHHISVIAVQANLARYVFESSPATARTALDTITGTSTEALDELRRLLGVLRPPQREPREYRPQPGLADLPALVARVREAGLTVTARTIGEPRRLPPGQQLCTYRIAQEALTNVLKHAEKTTAELVLEYGEEALVLSVRNSASEETPPPNPAGQGLIGMRERARMYGGSIEMGPGGSGDFAIVLTLPYLPQERTR